MLEKSIKVKANATVANVSCGFDCIGYAMSEPSDELIIKTKKHSGINISISGPKSDTIPVIP